MAKTKEQKNEDELERNVDKEKAKLKSDKIKSRDIKIKALKIGILIILLFLIIIYFILRVMYSQGAFIVSIDRGFSVEKGIVLYEYLNDKDYRQNLNATMLDYMDNISIKWLPDNIENEAEGSHNGENYMAYTFYIENQGAETVNYWYSIAIDEVTRDVDTAIRVMMYLNDEQTIYAKTNASTGEAEEDTTEFYSDEYVMMKCRSDFNPGDIDKITLVIWIEGDDPDCINYLIGGKMEMHMEFTEEQVHEN